MYEVLLKSMKTALVQDLAKTFWDYNHPFFSLPPPEGTNYHNILNKAVQADGQVKERYQSHRDTIALLCKPEAELNAAIPSANPAKTLQGNEVKRWNLSLFWIEMLFV